MSAPLVLCYHTVSDNLDLCGAVRPAAFRRQMQALAARGYRCATFSEALTTPPPGRTVCVTFDDAFLTTYLLALPILAELGFVATAFVPTTNVTTGERLAWAGYDHVLASQHEEMRPMSWAQIRELRAAGWEIGSHTRTHPHLTRIPDGALNAELRISREECEQHIGVACTAIAYPHGDVDDRVRDATELAGYRSGAALGPQRRRRDHLWWPRIGVYRDDGSAVFRVKSSPATHSRLALSAGRWRTPVLRGLGRIQRPA